MSDVEKRYLHDVARVLVLWMRGGCQSDVRAVLADVRAGYGAVAEAVHARTEAR